MSSSPTAHGGTAKDGFVDDGRLPGRRGNLPPA
eukprot:CAMPEP_0173377450 /NCGR_PEP_ID=MMETSP1356-20130122/669_1 /TAXON_ID=77927 ORGANISM="Hemiselmis virescens, Strain PCC157" /NCGR_SAMPLE_ID=MMETSP1356 /ASSEMBLY_ACC=CAM_ASM_000847 /LENGTH=32 /DNA_ID= /DNA_START= /DNA_END= /DNA_ORIENTATION=